MKFIKFSLFGLMILMLIGLLGCSEESQDQNGDNSETEENEGTSGGNQELTVAYDATPPTMDPHMTTALATLELIKPVYEGLVALDTKYVPQPMLAESWTVSEDGKEIVFQLREDIKFHNGETLDAEDVVASLERWIELSVLGKGNFSDATIEAVDPHTVSITLTEPNALAVVILANPTQGAVIMPKETIENAGADGIEEYIGTGPYKLEEYIDGQSLTYKKFADYQSLEEPADGLSGKKEALVETIKVEIVTDPSTRVAGIQTGQYDIAVKLPIDNYETLQSVDGIDHYAKDPTFGTMILNQADGVFQDQAARQAVLASLDIDDISMATFGSDEFYEVNHSLAVESQVDWYNEAGQEKYNAPDIEKAKQLLEESGYNGEEVVLLVTRLYSEHYNAAIAIEQQLKEVGFNVKLEVYDWTTLLEVRDDPTVWDLTITTWPAEAIPSNFVFLYSKNEYPGWIQNELMDSLIDGIKEAPSQEEALELFSELQAEFYDYVPTIKYAEFLRYHASRDNIKGFDGFYGIHLWNVTKEE